MNYVLPILVAYPYFSKEVREALLARDPSEFTLIVDSGAFTAWNSGGEVVMDDYIKFLRGLPSEWNFRAIQLDAIAQPEKTKQNYDVMLDAGLDVIPVFTRGAPMEHRDYFYEHTDYIAVGGIADKQNRAYLRHLMKTNGGRKVHWLGYTDLNEIIHFKPASTDSSGITGAQRYGQIPYYVGRGKLKSLARSKFTSKPPADFINSCKQRGFTVAEVQRLGSAEAWKGAVRKHPDDNPRGLASFIAYTQHIARNMDIEANTGTKMYLAFATATDMMGAFHALDFMKERSCTTR